MNDYSPPLTKSILASRGTQLACLILHKAVDSSTRGFRFRLQELVECLHAHLYVHHTRTSETDTCFVLPSKKYKDFNQLKDVHSPLFLLIKEKKEGIDHQTGTLTSTSI